MYAVDTSDMHLLLTYSDVFEGPAPDLSLEIPKLNMHKSISIITELISIINKKCPILSNGVELQFPAETFVKMEILGKTPDDFNFFSSDSILRRDRHIISSQMLMLLLKRIIGHGDYNTLSDDHYVINKSDYKFIIQLQLALVDEISQSEKQSFDQAHFLYGTYHLNGQANTGCRFLRSYYLLEELCQHRDRFDADVKEEYRDYYAAFQRKYGISTTHYASLLFWELQTYYSKYEGLRCTNNWKKIETTYSGAKNKDLLHKALAPISIHVKDLRQWAVETETAAWDFSQFLAFPFILDDNGQYISVSEYTLSNAFFEKLFWLIRDCYPESDSRSMAFYGRLFEKYIQEITLDAASTPYRYIAEFPISHKKKTLKSSDAYLQNGANLLAVEAKGFADLVSVMSQNQRINKNNHKLFIDPVLQADTFADIAIQDHVAFEDVSDIYIVSVTMNNINANPIYYETIMEAISKGKKCSKVKYYFNLSIEEYEMLMYLVESGVDVFELLKSYFESDVLPPFSTYVKNKYPTVQMTSFMKNCYDKATKEMMELLSSNESDK